MAERLDLAIVAAYFGFILLIGVMFRRQVSDASDYFRGGGKLLWWMSGSSAFMTTFSAWTFTGAAGKAYTDGLSVVIIFLANAVSYFFCAALLAGRFRQLRVDAPLEAYRKRYGRFNEQLNLWISFLTSQLPGGITLIAVSIFVSAVFGWDLQATIVGTGAAVVVVTLSGGAWAVIASDFVQAMLIIAITIVAGWQAIAIMGGIEPILREFPAENVLTGDSMEHTWVFVLWSIAILLQRLHDVNNLDASRRFLAAKDSRHARKAALMSAALFAGASLIWFLPPMVSAIKFPDLSSLYPNIANETETAYLAFVDQLMPAGTLGLLFAAMFAATMSSMDSALNGGSAMIVRCFYNPVLRKHAKESELLMAGRVATILIGAAQISIAVYISNLEGYNLFNLMLSFLGLFGLPLIIPGILSFFLRRTPDWSAWSTVLLGFGVSWVVVTFADARFLAAALAFELNERELQDLQLVITYAAHLTITVGWFFLTTIWYRPLNENRRTEVAEYYENLETPVVSDERDADIDALQRRRLGWISVAFGAFVCGLRFAGDDPGRSTVFFGCGGILLSIGIALLFSARAGQLATAKSGLSRADRLSVS